MSTQAPAAASSQEAERLRAERGLRAVTPEEEGTDVFHLPDGVFGHTFSPAFKEIPIFSVNRYQAFEVHRLMAGGGVHILGFVQPDQKTKMDAKSGPVDLLLYPASYQQATVFVSIPFASMSPAKKALSREDGNPFRTTVLT